MGGLPKTQLRVMIKSRVLRYVFPVLCMTWEMTEIDFSHHVACKCITTKYVTAALNILIVTLIIWPDFGRLQPLA